MQYSCSNAPPRYSRQCCKLKVVLNAMLDAMLDVMLDVKLLLRFAKAPGSCQATQFH